MKDRRSPILLFLVLGLLASLGVFLILRATPEGLGISDDSIAYVAGARSILSGQGYREAWLASNGPVTHFPPGFSALLALVGLSGLDPLRGARFVNSLLFGVNAFLLGLIGWRMTKSQIAGIFLALLFVANASLLRVHAVAMSEPLYIFLSLLSFLAFYRYYETFNGRWLLLTGLFVGMAYLTRYAGLALLATFVVVLILLHEPWQQPFKLIGTFLLGAFPFLAGWSIRNELVAGNATNRTLAYHPLSVENIQTGIYNISEFLIPVEAWRRAVVKVPNLIFIIVGFIGLVILLWILIKGLRAFFQASAEWPEILSFTTGLYIFGYLASILSSMMLFDASTKFKLRILSPVYISLLVLLAYFMYWLWHERGFFWRSLVAIFAIFVIVLSANETYAVVTQLQKGGQGYASFQWYDSEAMAFLRKLPEGTRIYTNQPGPVYLYTGRPNYVLPDLVDPVTDLPRGDFEQGVASLQQDVLSGHAVLALFKFSSEAEEIRTTYTQLAEGLYLAHDSHGDKIYTAKP